MAYIRPLKNGKFRAEVEKLGVRDSSTFKNRTLAKDWVIRREAEIMASVGADGVIRKKLADVLDEYLHRYSRRKAGQRYELLRIEALKRDFGWLTEKQMAETTTADWAKWRDQRLITVSGSTVLREINLYSAVYQKAMHELGPYCRASPFTRLERPKNNPLRTARWDWRLIKFVVRQLGYKTGAPPRDKRGEVAYALLIALRTAMRAQEVLSLSDDNVSMQTRVAVVAHKMQYATGQARTVPMQRQAIRLMRALSLNAKLHGRRMYFTMTPEHLDANWRKARAQMAVNGVTFHDTRAEAITRLARRVDVLTLSAISGIKDLRLLNERYYRERADQIAARL